MKADLEQVSVKELEEKYDLLLNQNMKLTAQIEEVNQERDLGLSTGSEMLNLIKELEQQLEEMKSHSVTRGLEEILEASCEESP